MGRLGRGPVVGRLARGCVVRRRCLGGFRDLRMQCFFRPGVPDLLAFGAAPVAAVGAECGRRHAVGGLAIRANDLHGDDSRKRSESDVSPPSVNESETIRIAQRNRGILRGAASWRSMIFSENRYPLFRIMV